MTEDRSDAIGEIGGHVAAAMDSLLGSVASSDVFAEPITSGDSLVVMAAVVERAGGFGFGGGQGDEPAGPTGGGGGGGGGGTAAARPVAVIRIDEQSVTIQPVVDVTRLMIAALGTLVALWRAARRR